MCACCSVSGGGAWSENGSHGEVPGLAMCRRPAASAAARWAPGAGCANGEASGIGAAPAAILPESSGHPDNDLGEPSEESCPGSDRASEKADGKDSCLHSNHIVIT